MNRVHIERIEASWERRGITLPRDIPEHTLYMGNAFKKFYPSSGPKSRYHNWDHAQEVVANMFALIAYGSEHGMHFPKTRILKLIGAAFGHDAGELWPLQLSSYENAEARSQHLTEETLTLIGYNHELVAAPAGATIPATRPGSRALTEDEILLRRADTGNLSQPYHCFKQRTLDFYHEQTARKGLDVSFKEWLPTAAGPLLMLLDDDLVLGDFDRGPSGLSIHHEAAFDNFARIHEEC